MQITAYEGWCFGKEGFNCVSITPQHIFVPEQGKELS